MKAKTIIEQNETNKLKKLTQIEKRYNLSNHLKSNRDENVDDLIKYFSHHGSIVKHISTTDYTDDRHYEI
jgi:LPS O-antigen subunit length determinant protein (WzzB/FepE family)